MIDSDSMIRFTGVNPVAATYKREKDEQRERIARDTARFLESGGQIQVYDSSANRNPAFGYGTMKSLSGRDIPVWEGKR